MENRFLQARGLMSVIQAAEGRLRIEGDRLVCGPKEVATAYAAKIKEYKAEIISLLLEPKSMKQLVLESIRAGICPDCGEKLNQESTNHDGHWFCSNCREHIVESHFDAPAISAV